MNKVVARRSRPYPMRALVVLPYGGEANGLQPVGSFLVRTRFGLKLPGTLFHRRLFSIAEGLVLFGAVLTLARVNLLRGLSKNNFPFTRLAQSSRLRQSTPCNCWTLT